MVENSKIEWTHHTFNPWWGCTEVSPACDHCYARELATRFGKDLWGNKDRMRTSENNWKQPLKWNREAEANGIRPRVFGGSMCDPFDNKVPPQWRADYWDLIRDTPHLDWLLLTKRPQNIRRMLPVDWGDGWHNVWLGMTAENREEYDKRADAFFSVPAVIHFLSMEPLLGPVELSDISNWKNTAKWLGWPLNQRLDWVIVGGESGLHARPMHPDWARSLRDQCQAAGVPFFFKQWGEYAPVYDRDKDDPDWRRCDTTMKNNQPGMWWNRAGGQGFHGEAVQFMKKMGKGKAGRLLDGVLWDEFPKPVDALKATA